MWGWAVVGWAAAGETRIASPAGDWGTLRLHDTNLAVELVPDDRYFAELVRGGPGEADVEESTDDGVHRLEVRVPARSRGWTLRVHVPAGLSVQVADHAGPITADGVAVDLLLADIAGPITATGLASLDARDVAGGVTVAGVAGDVSLRDIAGPVSVSDVRGTVTARDIVGPVDAHAVGQLVTDHVVGKISNDERPPAPPRPGPPPAVLRPRP